MKIFQNIMPKLKPSYLTAAAVIAILPVVATCVDNGCSSSAGLTTTVEAYIKHKADSMKLIHNLNDATFND